MSWRDICQVSTVATEAERANDVWDNDNCCNYSSDGTKLLEAENFPSIVNVREGTKIICDEVFAFQKYMDEDRPLTVETPIEEMSSFLDKIHLPNSITHIGNAAFANCGYLNSIKLPVGLQYIGSEAFMNCWGLSTIAFPSQLLAIGDDSFSDCLNLQKVRFNKALKSIGAGAFFNCENLYELILPSGLEYIGEDAFTYCPIEEIYVHKVAIDKIKSLLPKKYHRKLRILK